MSGKGFEIIEHTADIGIKVWAEKLTDLFIEAARAMFSILVDSDTVKRKEKKRLVLEAENVEELFLKWLKELLYILEKEEMLFTEFHIENNNFTYSNNSPCFIQAELRGEKLNLKRHGICTEIKAVTRHNFFLKKKDTIWKTFVLFDI